MHEIAKLSARLRFAQQSFLILADAIPPALWASEPSPGRWSAAELVAHLCQVERGVLGYADRVIRKEPLRFSFFKRIHFPLALVEARIIKRQSPIPLDPELLAGKETMLAELRGIRERTLAFLDETKERDLAAYCWPHPFLGRLNFYEWFAMVASHQIRHTKQMAEISKNLPNRVATALN